jgi:hypothetical protein
MPHIHHERSHSWHHDGRTYTFWAHIQEGRSDNMVKTKAIVCSFDDGGSPGDPPSVAMSRDDSRRIRNILFELGAML